MAKIPERNLLPYYTRPQILLDNHIPKPLHGLNPRTLLGKEWWDKIRTQVYKQNNYCCWACGIHKTQAKYYQRLEAHESYEIDYKLARMTLKEVVALCHSCHNYIHKGRLKSLLDKQKITRSKFDYIINRGDKLTRLLEKPVRTRVFTDWSKWHLMINGFKFYSRFKNEKEWEKHYGRYS